MLEDHRTTGEETAGVAQSQGASGAATYRRNTGELKWLCRRYRTIA